MFSLKSFLFFILGILLSISSFFIYKRLTVFIEGSQETAIPEGMLRSPLEFTTKIYNTNGSSVKLPSKQGSDAFVLSKTAIKTTIGVYNQNSTCFIDVSTSAGFDEKSEGRPNYVRIIISDPSSFASRNECAKVAMESMLPLVLNDGYASLVKAKIYEEGTILKEFSKEQLEAYAKTLTPVLFDGGFLFESLNIGLLSTPIVFEIHITDCGNVKCGE